jgi:hypothetical protein
MLQKVERIRALQSKETVERASSLQASWVCNPGYQDPAGWQDAGLLNYMFIATVALLTAGIDVARGSHASRDIALLALVVIVILLANQGQLVANVGMNLVTIDLLAQ